MATIKIDQRQSRGWVGLVASLAACLGVAALGGYWTSMGLGPWYDGLIKPSWTPPSAVFGPVWTTLYVLMAVSSWLVWRARGWTGAKVALGLYAAQLVLNLFWSGIFFGLRLPGPAFFEVALLWVMIAATMVAFFRVRRVAGLMLMPYWIWVSYASALNFALWQLNGGFRP